MKTKPAVLERLPARLLIATLAIGPLYTFAQTAPAVSSENRPVPQRPTAFPERLAAIVQLGDFGFIRVLTEEQRNSFREAMADQRDKSHEIEEKLRDARKEVVAAGLVETFNEAKVREKALEVGKREAELAVIRARALSKVKPPLSADQIEQIKNPPPFKPGQDRLRPVRRVDRPNTGPRDGHNLPAEPKAEK